MAEKKEKPKSPEKQEKSSSNPIDDKDIAKVIVGRGVINLVIPVSEEELKKEEKSFKINFSAILLVFGVVLIILAVIGFNIYTKQTLNQQKLEVQELKNMLETKSGVIKLNDAIVDRINLYFDINETLYSADKVLTYWEKIIGKYGVLTQISLGEDLSFTISGRAPNLESVAKIWHLLSVDKRVEEVNLDSFSSGENVSFKFSGKLKFEEFKLDSTQDNGQ